MSKEKANKMTGRGENKSFYHFLITNNDTNETNYFRTCKDITETYGICKATIYNMISSKHRPVKYTHLSIERFYQPI